MIRKLGWLAAGGFAVGIVAFSLAAALGAHELEGWNLRWLLSAVSSCHDDQDAAGRGTAATRSRSPLLPRCIIAAEAATR